MLKLFYDFRCTVAGPLLRAGRGEIYVALGRVALLQKLLDRLEKCHDRGLGVSRSATPDLAVGDVAGKRLVLPFALGRDYVLMAHEQYRHAVARALPFEQQIAVNDGFFKLFMHKRKQPFENLVEAEKFLNLGNVRVRYRLVPHHLRQLARKLKGVVAGFGRCVVRALVRRQNRAHNCCGRQRKRRRSRDQKQ